MGKKKNTSRTLKSSKETFPHFRYYKKSKHPALIIGERKNPKKDLEEYNFHQVMHTEKHGRHVNTKVEPNPNPNDPKPMFIASRLYHDKKKFFGKRLPWKIPKK